MGTTATGSKIITSITGGVPSTWTPGQAIAGTGIPVGSTITRIRSATSIAISQAATAPGSVTLMVTGGSLAGGNTDFYYSPYISSTPSNPGTGGTTATNVNGHSGAVVIVW